MSWVRAGGHQMQAVWENTLMEEPRLLPNHDEFMVPCPYCQEQGTHRGTCRLSYMTTGEVFAVVAKRVTLEVLPDHNFLNRSIT